jgi:hypothetical protein
MSGGRPKLRARSIVQVPPKFGFAAAKAINERVIIAATVNNVFLAIIESP